jgi:hypothetical protein
LTGVSCTSPSTCVAVGFAWDNSNVYMALAERWDGITWTVQATPDIPTTTRQATDSTEKTPGLPIGNFLNGVACYSPSGCIAVGNYMNKPPTNSSPNITLVEHWNGNTWAIQQTPTP